MLGIKLRISSHARAPPVPQLQSQQAREGRASFTAVSAPGQAGIVHRVDLDGQRSQAHVPRAQRRLDARAQQHQLRIMLQQRRSLPAHNRFSKTATPTQLSQSLDTDGIPRSLLRFDGL